MISTPSRRFDLLRRVVLSAILASLICSAPTTFATTPLPSVARPARQEIAFVDGGIEDVATLVAGLPAGLEVVVLDPTRDGLAQMAAHLDGRSGLGALHIISHGGAGRIRLGHTWLDQATLGKRPADLATLGRALASDGDILLYGCAVGDGTAGTSFVDTLAALTSSNVAASTNLTGNPVLGGDSVLEMRHGAINTSPLDLSLFSGVLVETTLNFSTNDDGNWADGIAEDGNGGSTNIAGIVIQISNVSDTSGTLIAQRLIHGNTESSDSFFALTSYASPAMDGGWRGMQIKSSTGAEFQINGFEYWNWGELSPITITVKGYRDGVEVASTFGSTANVGFYQRCTFTLDSTFDNVDTVILYSSSNSWHGINAIKIDDPVPSPTVTSVNSSTTNGTYKVGDTVSVQVNFSAAVTVTGTPQLTLETGTTDRAVNYASGSGTSTLTFTYTVQAGDTSADLDYKGTTALALNSGTIKSGGGADAVLTLASPGAANSLGNNKAIVIDGVVPTVSSVNSSTTNATYKPGDTVSIQVNFSEAVTVTGTPQLTLETGTTDRTVNYASGSGTSSLTFTYTVQAGDTSADLDYQSTSALALNAGTIKDAAGNNATLTLASPGAANSLGNNKAIVIDGVVPTVTSVNSSTANATYKPGDTISVQVNFSEAVTVTGTPQITLETGTTDEVVNYASGSGTSALTFTYTVQSGDTSADLDYQSTSALALNAGTIKDAAGNNTTLTLASPGAANSLGNNKAIVIDGVVPTVSSVNSSTANATYKVGDTVSVQVNFTEAVTVTGTPQLTLETGTTDRTVNYASGSGTSSLTFTYTVQAGDTSADLDYQSASALALNAGTIQDAAGNNATLTLASPGAANSLGNNKAIVIDGVAPTVSSVNSSTTNATYKPGDTVSIQVNFSEAVTVTGTPQLTLETGTTDEVVNYASGSGTNSLTFTYTVQSGDTSADLDYQSTSALALNAGTIKDAAGNNATLTLASPGAANSLGNNKAIVIDTTAPTTTVATAAFSADTGTSSTDFITKTAAQTISGTLSANMVSGEIVEVSLDNGSTWTTATTSVGANTWSLSGQTLTSSNTLKVRVSDTVGNSGTTASQAYVLDTTAPTTTVATAAFSADTGTSSTDFITKTAAQTISGTLSANMVSGEIVEVSLDNGSTWTTATTSVGANTWSLSGQTLTSSNTLKVRVSDIAGNSGTTASQAYVLDTTAPSAPATPDMTSGTDTGASGTDNITSNATPTFTGTAEASSTVTLYDTDGTTVLGTATATGGNWSITASTLSAGSHTLTAKATDAAGNTSSASSSLSVTIDTTAPGAPSAFTAVATGSTIALSWTNPVSDFASCTIRRSTSAYPTSVTDGTAVVAGSTGTSYSDTSLADGTYYYAIFALDAAGNISSSATASATVDTTAPTVTDAKISLSGASGTGGTFKIGDTVTATWNNTAGGDNNTEPLSAVTVNFTQFGGGAAVTATNSSGTWTANYTITAGALDATNRNVSFAVTDNAGNPTTTADTTNATVDNQAPTVTAANIAIAGATGTAGAFKVGDTISAIWNNTAGGDNNADTLSAVTVDFTQFGGGAAVAATNSSGTWTATYTIVAGFGAAGSRNVSVTVTDNAGNVTTTADNANATIENLAPVNSVPSAQSLAQDGALVFNSANSNLISISDADAGSASLQVTLTAAHGTLSLSGVSGLSFTVGSGTGNTTMTFTGTQSAINTALSGLTYTPTAGYSGSANIQISTSDLGNTGSGGTQTDTDTITLTINPSNLAPTNITLSSTSVNRSAGANATVGTLGSTDTDSVSFTYSLVSGTGSTANGSFNISGATLHANDASLLAAGSYSIRIRTTDDLGATFEKIFGITVVDDPSAWEISAAEDFNGDGKPDLFWTNTTTGDRAVWLMSGRTVVTNTFVSTVPLNWSVSAAGDFNGDGKADIFWTDTTTGDRAVWLMDGGTVIGGAFVGWIPLEWQANRAGDFDGDGKDDILWTNTTTGERSIWLMNGTSFRADSSTLGTVPVAWEVSGTGDYNGDGKDDILWTNTTTGDRAMWLMNGTTITANSFVSTVPTTWAVSGSGDFNGDGKADIFWTNTATGDRAVWLMNGSTMNAAGYLGAVPVAWVAINTNHDSNADGKADILWSNSVTRAQSVWFLDGTTAIGGE